MSLEILFFFTPPPLVLLPCFTPLYTSPSQIVNILKVLARKPETDKLSIKFKWNALIFARVEEQPSSFLYQKKAYR